MRTYLYLYPPFTNEEYALPETNKIKFISFFGSLGVDGAGWFIIIPITESHLICQMERYLKKMC